MGIFVHIIIRLCFVFGNLRNMKGVARIFGKYDFCTGCVTRSYTVAKQSCGKGAFREVL